MSGKPTGYSNLQAVQKLLTIFFLFIFSFQVLPVKEIGKILFNGTMVEEIHESAPDNDEPTTKLKLENDPYTHHRQFDYACRSLMLTSGGLGLLKPESISKQHIPDIITPPPNIG